MMEGEQLLGTSLLEDAKKYELQTIEKNKAMLLELSALERLLIEVYETHRPSSEDYDNRRDLIRIFNEIAREIHGNDDKCPVVKAFGSFLMELFDAGCDLDLSVNLHDNDENADRFAQVKTLRKFANKFSKLQRNRHVSDVQLILSARVPVLKVTDCGSGIECDLSVGNLDGILKSQIVRMISDIDERFRKLSVLMKLWAKANNINSAKDGTINSYSFILLAAFHLQTRDIPILPPFSAILKDGLDPEAVNKNIQGLLKYGESNKESLAELFVSMLIKLESVSSLWSSGLCASTYEGSWILKKLGSISIEDFTNRSQNTCRALKRKKMGTVSSCIRNSINKIRLFSERKIDAVELYNQLFQAKPNAKSGGAVKAPKKGKRKRRAEMALRQSEEKSKGPIKTCPENIQAPSPSKVTRDGANNVCSTSYGRVDKSQEILLGAHNNRLVGTKTCPENIQAPSPSKVTRVGANNVCSASYGRVDKSTEIPLGARNQRLVATSTFQGSRVLRPEVSQNYPAGQQIRMSNPPVLGYRGIRSNSPRGWPYHPLSADYRPERSQVDHFDSGRNFLGPVDYTAPSFMPGHPLSAGYRPERSRVDHFDGVRNFPGPVDYSWSTRPSGFLSHYPSAPNLFPPMPAQFAQNSVAPENREHPGHRSYQPRGNHLHLPIRRFY